MVDGVECGSIMDVNVNLLEIVVEKNPDIQDVIRLNNEFTIKLTYPKFSIVNQAATIENVDEFAFKMIADSVEYIHDGEQFYYAKDSSPEEIMEFLEQLNQEQFAKIEEFFNNLPKLRKDIDVKCKKCGYEHHIEVEGLESFFD